MGTASRLPLLALGVAVLSASCTVTAGVRTERADPIAIDVDDSPFESVPAPTDPGPTDPPIDPSTSSPSTDPPTTSTTVPPPLTVEPDPAAIDFGIDKPPRDYDEFLLAAVTDLEIWWTDIYPALYGEPFDPLQGEVYAAYPERPDDLPGCGEPRTRYEDVQEFVAFYCGLGDFVVYDDGDEGLLFELAEAFGPATIGIVLAHEFGHAIQQRAGALAFDLPTVRTEQQADCFAGAWAGRAARGESGAVRFGDRDVRAGLIAMINVEDPLGVNQLSVGGHGSGFDRVGAFQVGFQDGPAQCAELLDNPLPLTPNQFRDLEERQSGGDAVFGYGDDELLGFIPADLNLYWDVEVDADFPGFSSLTLRSANSLDEVGCTQPVGRFDLGAAMCPNTGTVYLNQPQALEYYDEIGDFAVGYVIAILWSEAIQASVGSELTGERRALTNDCLAGAWVKTVTPGTDRLLPQPRAEDRTVSISPGDLTEAIQTILLIGDVGSDDDVLGTAFEKIDAFRNGALGGLDACSL